MGDFDGNGEIAFPDFLVLSANFGETSISYPASHRIRSKETDKFFSYYSLLRFVHSFAHSTNVNQVQLVLADSAKDTKAK